MANDSSSMTHEEVQKVLPWYANHRLDAEASRRVEAHLADCAICRGDVDGLSTVLAAHERSLPERPVNEARLDALFARIDQHEAERRRAPQRAEPTGVIARAVQWLTVRPALAAGSLAAVLLATAGTARTAKAPPSRRCKKLMPLKLASTTCASFWLRPLL